MEGQDPSCLSGNLQSSPGVGGQGALCLRIRRAGTVGVPVMLSQSFTLLEKLHCRVLNLQNTRSPLFRGERKPCHFNMGFKLDPLWNSPGKCGEE